MKAYLLAYGQAYSEITCALGVYDAAVGETEGETGFCSRVLLAVHGCAVVTSTVLRAELHRLFLAVSGRLDTIGAWNFDRWIMAQAEE